MKVHTKKFSTIIILSLLAFIVTFSVCSAQDARGPRRSGKSEIYGIVQTLDGYTGLNDDGVKWGLDDGYAYGIGVGYNATDHFNINMDLAFDSQDVFYKKENIGSMHALIWNVNLDYNISKGPLTPLVSGGMGFATYSDEGPRGTEFTYNIGAGGRWDISDKVFMKVTYRKAWFPDNDYDQDGIFLGIGYMF